MNENFKSKKREQHQVYHTFLVMMCVVLTAIGVIGIIGYFDTGKIAYTITAAIGIIVSILLITSDKVKSTMIYPLRGE